LFKNYDNGLINKITFNFYLVEKNKNKIECDYTNNEFNRFKYCILSFSFIDNFIKIFNHNNLYAGSYLQMQMQISNDENFMKIIKVQVNLNLFD